MDMDMTKPSSNHKNYRPRIMGNLGTRNNECVLHTPINPDTHFYREPWDVDYDLVTKP